MSSSKSIDHRSFVAALPADTKARLTQRSAWRGALHLMAYLALILAFGAWIVVQGPYWGFALLPLGILLAFLFTLEHECTHKTPFAQHRLNEWVGRICGLVLILPFEWFRYFHLAHHRWTNIPGKDPELAQPRPQTWGEVALYTSGVPFWCAMIHQVVSAALARPQADYIPKTARARIMAEARMMMVLYAGAAGSLLVSPVLLWVWIVPVIIGQPFVRLYLLAEHGDCPQVANMFENTRTTFTTKLVRFLAWNMPYHAEHHIYPNVPFHNLPALHDEVKTHLKVTADGYGTFTKDYLARRANGPAE